MRRPRSARPSDAIAWIKSLRHARVEGLRLRQRFTFRGDSLWWFAELYLHKQQVIADLFRALAALEALVERERPQRAAVRHGRRHRAGPRAAGRRGTQHPVSTAREDFAAARL